MKAGGQTEGDELVPFHKLTGWTTYSLVEPIEKILGWKFDGLEDMTGLPEYRNGACAIVAWPRLVRPQVCGARSLMFFFTFLFSMACVCVGERGAGRWAPYGPRRGHPEAFGRPRILLPLCVIPNSPASAIAPCNS
jgi:hypothetical protein